WGCGTVESTNCRIGSFVYGQFYGFDRSTYYDFVELSNRRTVESGSIALRLVLKLRHVIRFKISSNCRIVELSNCISSHRTGSEVTAGTTYCDFVELSNCGTVESVSSRYDLF